MTSYENNESKIFISYFLPSLYLIELWGNVPMMV